MPERTLPADTVDRVLADVKQGVRALDLAVTSLQKIALMGGVQGDWAKDAIAEIGDLMVGKPTPVISIWDRALGEGRN